MIAFIRAILAVILLLASLLAVIHAPSYLLWEGSIAVNEWGHYLAILGLLLILPGWSTPTGKVAATLAQYRLFFFCRRW